MLLLATISIKSTGSMADLTAEEDEELKEIRGAGARRDFSVIFSHSRNVNHLFLGPARFVNVSLSMHNVVNFETKSLSARLRK